MNRNEIENSKVVVIGGAAPLQQFISLEFVPDYAILKYVTVSQTNAATFAAFGFPVVISTDLGYTDNNNLISIIPEPFNTDLDVDANTYINICSSHTDLNVKLPNFVNKNYNFSVTSPFSNTDLSAFTFSLGLTFEFIKYKNVNK